MALDERDFFVESRTTRAIDLTCTFCRTKAPYDLPWVVRKKKGSLPRNADDRDKAKFSKMQSYMVLAQDKVTCSKCRRNIEVSGTKTLSFLTD